MDLQEMINHIAAGDSMAAKESIENALSAKAFDALQSRKQEIASTLFGGQEQMPEEVTENEELAYEEGVEVDGEQLDEVSLKLASRAYRDRKADAYQRGNNRPWDSDVNKAEKADKTAERIKKKFGAAGERRVKRIDSMSD